MDIKILTRVRALLAKAESTTFPEEAEALTAKAMELMASHGITDAMLVAAGQRDDPIGEGKIELTDPYSFEKSQLLACVCEALRCRVVFWSRGRRVLWCDVTGHASDRERVELLFTSLLLQATSQVYKVRPRHDPALWWIDPAAPATVANFRRSWWAGFSYQVQVRLTQTERKAAADYDAAHQSNGAELVLVDRRTQVDRYFEDRNPQLKVSKNKTTIDPAAFMKGMQAGNAADLGDGGLGAPTPTSALGS
jgi:hypothetical protein